MSRDRWTRGGSTAWPQGGSPTPCGALLMLGDDFGYLGRGSGAPANFLIPSATLGMTSSSLGLSFPNCRISKGAPAQHTPPS